MRTVGVKLTAEVASYISSIKAAGESTRGFVGDLNSAAKKGNLDAVASRATMMGGALVGAFGFAVKSAADFDKAMSSVSAATHAGAAEMSQLRAAALQAGKDTQYSATQAADGITQLSKAGISTANILNGGLKGALSLAAAGQISVGEAAETAASAMTQFKLSGSQVPHVADLLAAAAGKAQGGVHEMGYALSQSGLVAAQFGLSIEDTTGVLAEFASAGMLGSDAGTSLKTMLLALANPSKQTRDKMNELGISFYDAQGKFIGLSGVAQVLQTRLKGLTEEQRQQTLGQIFGNDAIRGASILYSDGAAGVEKWKNAVNDSGYAASTAQKQTDNLAGDLERLRGSFETLAIQGGSGPNGGLRIITKGLNDVVNHFLDLPPAISSTLTVMAGLTGAVLLGGAGWVKYQKFTSEARAELVKLGPAGERTASAVGKVSSAVGKAGLVLGAMQVASIAVGAAMGSGLNPQIDALTGSLKKWAASGEKSGEAARLLGNNFQHLSYDLGTLGSGGMAKFGNGVAGTIESLTGLGDVFDESLQHAHERLQAIDQALTQLQQQGQSDQAAAIFTQLEAAAKKAGISVDDLKKGLPQYAAALQTAGDASGKTAGATGDLNSALETGAAAQKTYKTAADAVTAAAHGERDALVDLSNKMKAETDPVFALLDAQTALGKAQKTAADAIKQHGKNSEEAKKATRDLALAAIDLQGKAGALSSTFSGKMTPAMRQTLQAAGLTKQQIDEVAAQFVEAKKDGDAYAKNYGASVSLKGYGSATAQIQAIKDSLAGLSGKTITIKVKADLPAGLSMGNLLHHASGGPVIGPGAKGVDSVPALLAPGEHVLSAPEVDAMGGQAAVTQMRASALAHPVKRYAESGRPAATRVMPSSVAAQQRVIVETRVVTEFAGGVDAFGQLMANAFRVRPGLRATIAKTIGVPA